ncbi:IS110 family transposase [Streptomyces pactum]|uniref:IS110 family transposase n=1 Tax=Streptomyces pactum TaxID=68249 RepID=A0A1S6JH47_9ACTN|nr:IS110 family transposase [Streptomyces pactum]
MYKLAKDSAVKARTQAINQLKAVLVIADPALRERMSSLGSAELFRTCARLGPPDGGGDEDAVIQATHMTLRMLAERIEQLTAPCGVSPIEYSSGRRRTRRLNYGGDRQANAALHRIVFTRLRHDPRTQAYYERRTQEGKTRREIIRCLKRYAAREVINLVRPVSRTPAL